MAKNIFSTFFLIAIIAAVLIYLFNTSNCEQANSGGGRPQGDTSLQVLNTSEIDQKIKDLDGKPWDYSTFHLVDYSIENNLRNGLISDQESKSLQKRLNAVYITALNLAANEFIIKGKGNQALLYKELTRYYGESDNKAQVDEMFNAMRDFSTLVAQSKEISQFLHEKFEAVRRNEIQAALDAGAKKDKLKDSPYVIGFVREQTKRLDNFKRIDYYFESKMSSSVNCDSEYAEYEYYKNACYQRQNAPVTPSTSDTLH